MQYRTLESEVNSLNAEVTRLRIMVNRCVEAQDTAREEALQRAHQEKQKVQYAALGAVAAAAGGGVVPPLNSNNNPNYVGPNASENDQLHAAASLAAALSSAKLPMPGDPMSVLPSIFSGMEGTARLFKVLIETYPWLLPPDLREAQVDLEMKKEAIAKAAAKEKRRQQRAYERELRDRRRYERWLQKRMEEEEDDYDDDEEGEEESEEEDDDDEESDDRRHARHRRSAKHSDHQRRRGKDRRRRDYESEEEDSFDDDHDEDGSGSGEEDAESEEEEEYRRNRRRQKNDKKPSSSATNSPAKKKKPSDDNHHNNKKTNKKSNGSNKNKGRVGSADEPTPSNTPHQLNTPGQTPRSATPNNMGGGGYVPPSRRHGIGAAAGGGGSGTPLSNGGAYGSPSPQTAVSTSATSPQTSIQGLLRGSSKTNQATSKSKFLSRLGQDSDDEEAEEALANTRRTAAAAAGVGSAVNSKPGTRRNSDASANSYKSGSGNNSFVDDTQKPKTSSNVVDPDDTLNF